MMGLGETVNAEIEQAQSTTAAVIELAAAQIEQAQQTAADIAAAAIETELGRQIEALRQEGYKWQVDLDALRQALQQVQSELSETRQQLAATATLAVVELTTPAPQPDLVVQSSSTPQTSTEIPEALATVQTLLPESLDVVAAAPVVPVVPAKPKHRLL